MFNRHVVFETRRPAGQQKFNSFIAVLSFLLLIWAPQAEAGIPPMSKEQIGLYMETIRNDRDPATRLKAVIALHKNYIYGSIWIQVGRPGGPYPTSHLPELVQLFKRETNFPVKLALGILCAKIGDRTAVPFLVSALEQETYPDLGYEKVPFSLEGGGRADGISYTQWHILRALQTTNDSRASAALIRLYEQTKGKLAKAQSEADRSSRIVLLGQVACAMISTGTTEATEILIKELRGDVKDEELKCEEVLVPVAALGSKRGLETPEARQVLMTLLQKSSCEQVRESVARALGLVRDDLQVRQTLLKALYDDKALSVRKSAVVALWHEPNQRYSAAYIRQLSQETDPKRQQRLLDDLRSLEENWGPLPDELLQELLVIQRGLANEKFKAEISEIFDVEREQALASYEEELDSRDKGYGTYPESVRADYLDSLSVFLPSLSRKEIERIQTLSQREADPQLQKVLLNLLEEHRRFQEEKE